MSVKATIDGEVWEFDTAAEAVEFKRSMAAEVTPVAATVTKARKRGPKPARAAAKKKITVFVDSNVLLSKGTRQILEAVRHQQGLRSPEFARAIGSPSPRSVPVRMMVLSKELKALGFKQEDVIIRERIYVKGRAVSVFKPGPRIDDALKQTGSLFAAS
jgi:hypothetical protein